MNGTLYPCYVTEQRVFIQRKHIIKTVANALQYIYIFF